MNRYHWVSFLLLCFYPWMGFADFDVQDATQAYLDQLTPEQMAQSDAYFEGGYWIKLWDILYGILVGLCLLTSGLSAKMRSFSEKVTKWPFVHNFIYLLFYFGCVFLLSFPWSLYVGYFREHQYNLSNLTFGGWMSEQLKGIAIGMLIGGIFVALVYKVIRRMPQRWWLGGAVLSVVFLLIINFLFPVFLAPIFNDYKPLEEGPLKQEILSMARSNGMNAKDVFQFDASKQSRRISANVSGLGSTMRISLNDNLLNRSSREEILAVMGHELGHYVLNHVYKSTIYFGLLFLFGFYFLFWGLNNLFLKQRKRWGIRGQSDIALFPLAVVLFNLFFFIITPVSNTIVRSAEVEADLFGLNVARQPDGFASVAVKLSEYRKMSPGRWEEFLFYDHPSGRERIRMAMEWKKENLDKD